MSDNICLQTLIIKFIKIFIFFVLALTLSLSLVAQTIISEKKYDSLKYGGLINLQDNYQISRFETVYYKSTSYRPMDAAFNLAIPPSDDASSDTIDLPFTFCFYGEAKSAVFINNNGNISFDNIFTSGTPYSFPFQNFKVIAPFWSDVDTRVRGGVYYKLLPNAMIVSWEDVGYFDQNDAKGNTFQLIISDGTSELLPFGYTVGFFYQDIQWTAGDASGGVNGFGGAPALVGMNAGDNQKYILAGSYDKPDTSFFPKVDTFNGVEMLKGQHAFFNPCQATNLTPGLMGKNIRDTIGVCVGDTLKETYRFLAPEWNQNTYVDITSRSFPGFNLLGTTTGQMATASFEVVGSISNMGFHTLSFRVFDNGSPYRTIDYDITIQIDSLPQPLQIMGDTFICAYDSSVLSVPSGYETYLWNTLSSDSFLTVNNGTYTVTVSSNNCEVVETQKVVGYLPEPIITGPEFICLPNTVILNTNPSFDQFNWSTGDTTAQISVTQGGEFQLTVTDKGCFNTDAFYLEDSVFVKIKSSNLNSCNGDSVTLSIPDEYDEVFWSTGDTGNFIIVPAGNFWVEATVYSNGGANCVLIDSISIGAKVFPLVSLLGDSTVCGGAASHWNVVGNYDSYLWDDETTNSTVIYTDPGIHSVTVTFSTCFDSTSFQYMSISEPSVEIQGHLFHCDDVDSSQLVAAGAPWDSILWNTGDITDTIYTGIGQKNVTVWKDGCVGEDSFPVNELINGVDVKGITEICPGQSTRLTVELGFDLYEWSTGTIGISTNVNLPGDYWCVVHLDSCYATTDTVTISLVTPDSANILGDTIMCDSVGGYLQVDLAFRSFSWSTGEMNPSIFYSNPGVYSVTVEDSNYCITSDSMLIIQKPTPTVAISGDTHYCFNDSSLLSAGSFVTYNWANGDTTPILKARAGNYSVTVTDSNGCSASDRNYRVTSSFPVPNIFSDTVVCEGDSLWVYTFSKASDSILWSTGSVQDSVFISTEIISLQIRDTYGCVADSTRQILGLPTPFAKIEMDPENKSQAYLPVAFRDDSQLNGAIIQNWYWNVNDSIYAQTMDTSITFYVGTSFQVTHALSTDLGCTDTTFLNYLITDEIIKVNVMTPNGDGINDYLVIPNIQKYPNNSLRIYNRWGVEVAFFKPYRNNWDAYFVSDGVYFYVIELEQGTPALKGSITVIK